MSEPAGVPPPSAESARLEWLPASRVRRLLALAGLVIVLAVSGHKVFQAQRQRRAVAAIVALHGRVTYADQMPHAHLSWPITWVNSALGHDFAAPVVAVHLGGTAVHDDDLAVLQVLPQLEALWLQDTAVTDRGLPSLQSNTALRELSLRGTRVSDAGMASLTELPNLQFLYLHDTSIGDEGLLRLAALTQLRLLCVPDTKVTHAGVAKLHEMLPQTLIRD